ncbi:hypothetical protein [Salinigranum halophilum]|jgi:hypothetical protein|uniref:hypothetical protein n=1 Tax=Salinigranum halophilum TaxID=2565931 RepID=UPI0010A8B5FF|nr:hypothetical protein [Salinigranum halophilum]
MQDITTLVPGDLVKVPVEDQADKRLLIVDKRFPDRDGTVPLLGRRGGQYHLEQTKDVVHLNHYTHRRNDWVGAETFAVDRIEVNPDVEVER